MMKLKKNIVLFLDNYVGYEVLKILIDDHETNILYVITHPENTSLFNPEIKELCEINSIPISDINRVRVNFNHILKSLNIDYILSIYFDYILDERFLNLPKVDAINLHPGFLPYNKGFYYYAWSLIDGTPAGVSIHRMSSNVDCGDIISQLKVRIEDDDNGDTIYKKHEDASIMIFKATWPSLKNKDYKLYKQLHKGTHNNIKKTKDTINIDPYKKYQAIDLINLLRVFSFPGKQEGCSIKLNGKTYKINLDLKEIENNEVLINIPGGYQVN